jgi:hypothetical protein
MTDVTSKQRNLTVLTWPTGWDQLSRGVRLLAHVPVVGSSVKLRKECNRHLAARSEAIWVSWVPAAVSIDTVRRCCEAIAVEGAWSGPYFHPDDSFSLVCHDWKGIMRDQFDTDILNAACFALRPEILPRGRGFIDGMVKSLVRHGDLSCIALPPEFVDWSLLQFIRFAIGVQGVGLKNSK